MRSGDPFRCGIAPTWSLAIEVFFYAVLPFFAIGMGLLTARLPRRRWPAAELAVLAVLSAALVRDPARRGGLET